MAGINVIAADTDAEAKRLATTQQMSVADIFGGKRGLSKPPIDDIETYWSSDQKAGALRMLKRSVVGSPDSVRAGLRAFVDETKVDEVMVVSDVFDHQMRLRSLELIAKAMAV
jgi:alkanesulfonate monooxygenase SsuD/methylene tetrahydromethanopterin reductase-like flavin-dependent oxidoreductase (luciferase family)